MLLLRTEKLPEGDAWLHELKLDGYRALAIKSGGKVHLRSRNDNDFNARYSGVVKALSAMPDDTGHRRRDRGARRRRQTILQHPTKLRFVGRSAALFHFRHVGPQG